MAESADIGTLRVLLSAETAQYLANLEKARTKTRGVGEDTKTQVSGMSQAWGLLKVGGAIATASIGAVAGATAYLVKEAMAAQEADAQLNAVLASTGGVAGVTAGMAHELAGSYQEVTRYSDEQVLSAESLMLTFTNISGTVFPEAIGSALDMSTALKMDLNSAVMMVSKSLNVQAGDTAAAGTAMTAMKKSGVAFTTDQIAIAKQLVLTGDMMGYQKMILGELTTEFGGSAAAAGGTFAGQMDIAKNALSDVAEVAGGELIPLFEEFGQDTLPMVVDIAQTLAEDSLPNLIAAVGWLLDGLEEAIGVVDIWVTGNEDMAVAVDLTTQKLIESGATYDEYTAFINQATEATASRTAADAAWLYVLQEHFGIIAEGTPIVEGMTEAQYAQALAAEAATTSELGLMYQGVETGSAFIALAGATGLATEAVETQTVALPILGSALQDLREDYDLAATGAGLLGEAIGLLTENEYQAAMMALILDIATGNYTKTQLAAKLATLEELGVLQQLNTDLATGIATKEDFYAVVLGGVTTMDGYNEVLGFTTDEMTDVELATLAAKQQISGAHNAMLLLDGKEFNTDLYINVHGGVPTQAQMGNVGAGAGKPGQSSTYDVGGIIPGDYSTAVPIIAHGEEMVLTPSDQQGLLALIRGGGGLRRDERPMINVEQLVLPGVRDVRGFLAELDRMAVV